MRRLLLVLAVAFLAIPAAAQFRGASLSGNAVTAAARDAAIGNRDLTGQVLNHTRHDSYTFGDATGRIRVEIGANLWRGRLVTPKTRVRLTAEVALGRYGRFLMVDRLEIVS